MVPMLLALGLLLVDVPDVPIDSSEGKGGKAGLFADGKITVEGKEREYRLLVPKKKAKAAPLVFAFHGRGGNARRLAAYCGLDALARKEGFILVYPSAIAGNWELRSPRGNADLALVDALYADLCARYPVDRNRVYATGMSMGGYFSNFLAAHRSEHIAAIAPHSGGLGAVAFAQPEAKHKYAVLVIHGDADNIVPVSEGRKSKAHYERKGHPVVYEEIEGLDHRWAKLPDINEKIWAFFEKHPRGVSDETPGEDDDREEKAEAEDGGR